MTDTPVPNGSAEAPIELVLPSVVGINFGNSYASIAVLSKVSGSIGCDRPPRMFQTYQNPVTVVKWSLDLKC